MVLLVPLRVRRTHLTYTTSTTISGATTSNNTNTATSTSSTHTTTSTAGTTNSDTASTSTITTTVIVTMRGQHLRGGEYVMVRDDGTHVRVPGLEVVVPGGRDACAVQGRVAEETVVPAAVVLVLLVVLA